MNSSLSGDLQHFDADVAIVGGGPVGTLLAILLGQRGKRVTLIERWSHAYGRPRAVTYDHEIARILATLGIDSENDPAITYHNELYYWRNSKGENIQLVDWQSQSASGWRVRYWFNQPDLEQRLTRIVDTLPSVTQVRGWQAAALSQDEEGADLTIQRTPQEIGSDGQTRTIRAKYLVGADGANSFVRETLGIQSEDKGYFFDWLILDVIPNEPYTASPAQWQLCDPKRPTTIVPGGPGRRRWEYMVLPHESREEMQTPERAWALLKPWGMTPENAQLERSAVYRFQARWARVWNKGRCAIAGDAAHLMPPFAGEGMCAGLRDALALGWRLNGILEGRMGDAVLDSYTTERIEHARHYIEFSQELGKIICITDEAEAAARDEKMKADLAARNNKPVPTDVCHLGTGIWCADSAHAGELSVQGIVEVNGKRDRFDQAVGHGWFVIGLDVDPAAALDPAQLEVLAELEGRTARISTSRNAAGIVDVDGTYARWLSSIDAKYVIVRPDFYVAATANSPAVLQQRFDEIMSKLHLQVRETA
ncbi:bifunctional 3-(3-hydroxy-phenyl)propionate/3-hydroxycinnamic acid hydroxylase [Burkholderia multivorans]|uniref:bifunctional 3-(3-hydroxy-phenyl)propionate/3-hydroxycinnamic acid hydroxylase MhpA n=1 Tax=Burkholderia multivorans TaxID=87883 RepID=UPI000841886F|nr:bifunctional 3-(3-hydroxy-phenyl)propionate/3-hydroxycinnamic acid hydroxylase [Burkholderia multivorans]AOJ96518.1 3-(3-hydroxyphenyl)propionate hydroxylase [Burkholderia multivorans]MCA8456827.1 bifunctional 3-(3-hydroxy-phenyl)propionate/3-hydroxycinnamic acid hydroxylase [Burkholderia multivorans]